MKESTVLRGTVRWFSPQKGYGFVEVGEDDYFAHFSQITFGKRGRKNLVPDMEVFFDPVDTPKGKVALNIRLTPEMPAPQAGKQGVACE